MTTSDPPQPARDPRRLLAAFVTSRRAAPWCASFALHAILALVAGFVALSVTREPPPPPPARVTASLSAPSPAGAPAQQTVAEQSRPQEAQSQRPPLATQASLEAFSRPDAQAPPAPTTLSAKTLSPIVAPPTGALSASSPTPRVFGVSGERNAERIVYVIDASGSMVAALPIVIEEVIRSIDALEPSQVFQVAMSRNGRVESPESLADRTGLIRASASNKDAVRRWLRGVSASGRGDHLPALAWAIERRPDVVFLMAKGLTDTGASPSQQRRHAAEFLAALERLNPLHEPTGRRRVTVKAIEFFDADAENLLRTIGERHGGGAEGHTFISRAQLGLE